MVDGFTLSPDTLACLIHRLGADLARSGGLVSSERAKPARPSA